MITVYGDLISGNCYKIKLLVSLLDLPHQWISLDLLSGAHRTADMLALNPAGKTPFMLTETAELITESNAILGFLGYGTFWLPTDRLERARVDEWLFFEQHAVASTLAPCRWIKTVLQMPESRTAEYQALVPRAKLALEQLDRHLAQTEFLTGSSPTIADVSVFAYTHLAEEGGFELQNYSSVMRWIERLQNLSGFCAMPKFEA